MGWPYRNLGLCALTAIRSVGGRGPLHQESRTVGCDDLADAPEARLLVAADRARVLRRGIGLHARDVRILEDTSDERAHHPRPDALAEGGRVGEELIDAED